MFLTKFRDDFYKWIEQVNWRIESLRAQLPNSKTKVDREARKLDHIMHHGHGLQDGGNPLKMKFWKKCKIAIRIYKFLKKKMKFEKNAIWKKWSLNKMKFEKQNEIKKKEIEKKMKFEKQNEIKKKEIEKKNEIWSNFGKKLKFGKKINFEKKRNFEKKMKLKFQKKRNLEKN